jgi:hypothetical protein
MKLTRRGLFKLGAGVAAATAVGVPVVAHEHEYKQDIARLGYVCECGDFQSATRNYTYTTSGPTYSWRGVFRDGRLVIEEVSRA